MQKLPEEFQLGDLLLCPFCANDLTEQDPRDTIYQIATHINVWEIVCQESAGGCSATILGDSIQDCVTKWNTRT